MSRYGNCKHGIYLGGCRKCFPLPEFKENEWVEKTAAKKLTDEEIIKMVSVGLDKFRTLLKKAREK